MITRRIYLNNPEKWFYTNEEKELISFCCDYLDNKKNFFYSFSPVYVDIDGKQHINAAAKRWDQYFVTLSKGVLEVYNARKNKKHN